MGIISEDAHTKERAKDIVEWRGASGQHVEAPRVEAPKIANWDAEGVEDEWGMGEVALHSRLGVWREPISQSSPEQIYSPGPHRKKHFGDFLVAKTLLIAAISTILVLERNVKTLAGAE